MLTNRYLKLVRASAIYDLLATAAFATPWTFGLVHSFLSSVSPLPAFEPLHVLFANLLGTIVIVWSVLRVLRPTAELGLYDSVARALFFVWQLYYLLAMNGSPVVWSFAFFELAFCLTQAYGYWLLRKMNSNDTSSCRVVRYFAQAA